MKRYAETTAGRQQHRGLLFGAALALSTLSPLWFLESLREPAVSWAVARQGMAIIPATLLILALSGRLRTRRAIELTSAGLILTVGLSCAALVYLDDQPFGTFHHGLAVAMLAAGLLYTWSNRLTLAVFGVIILAYCAATAEDFGPGTSLALAEHAGFLVITGLVGWLGMRSSRRQLLLALRAEAETRASNDRMKEVAAAKDRSFAAIAQELRTLVALVEGPLRRLGWPDEPDDLEQLQAARTNLMGLARLSNDLLDLAGTETGILSPSVGRVSPMAVVSAVVEAARPIAREWGIGVVAAPSNAPPITELYGDKAQIERLLDNLVLCALERTAAPGSVAVGASLDAHHATFSIQRTGTDDGREDDGHHVFDGQTIRLRVVQELLRLHHGVLARRALPDGGIRVDVRLPLGKEHLREYLDQANMPGHLSTPPVCVSPEPSHEPAIGTVLELTALDTIRRTQMDPTTGLATRPALRTSLHHALALGQGVALVLIDLDGFVQVNDIHGQAVGDRVIAEVGRCLRRTTRSSDLCFRYGGDEFAVILPSSTDEEASAAANRVLQEIASIEDPSPPGLAGILATRIHASAGIALSEREDTVDSLLERATVALNEVKRRGGCGV